MVVAVGVGLHGPVSRVVLESGKKRGKLITLGCLLLIIITETRQQGSESIIVGGLSLGNTRILLLEYVSQI